MFKTVIYNLTLLEKLYIEYRHTIFIFSIKFVFLFYLYFDNHSLDKFDVWIREKSFKDIFIIFHNSQKIRKKISYKYDLL